MRRGLVDGWHFTTYVEEVKRLKRSGETKALERLLLDLVAANEEASVDMGGRVAPWYYEQLAILYRRLRNPRAEVEILELYARHRRPPGSAPDDPLLIRLDKARKRLG